MSVVTQIPFNRSFEILLKIQTGGLPIPPNRHSPRSLGRRRRHGARDRRVIHVDVQQAARAAELLRVALTEQITGRVRDGRRAGRERGGAVALLAVLDAGVRLLRGPGGAEVYAGLDGHAGAVGVRGAGQEASGGGLVIAALIDIVIRHLDGGRRHEGREAEEADSAGPAAVFVLATGA